jgi:hypothetical protein
MNGKELIFASLVGSKVVEQIPRLAIVENELAKIVVPAVPFLPFKLNAQVDEVQKTTLTGTNWKATPSNIENQFFPLSFRQAGTNDPWYTLPYEPLINITGKNTIIKRRPAKANNFIGTVKERWSQDDYDITITGVLMGENLLGDVENTYPRADFEKLKEYCTNAKGLEVKCEPLRLLNVHFIVVEEFNFPFTKGENVQAYEMKCLSDFSVDFLLELED